MASSEQADETLRSLCDADLPFVVTDVDDRVVHCGRAALARLGILIDGPGTLAECVAAAMPRRQRGGRLLDNAELPSSRALRGDAVEKVELVLSSKIGERWVRASARPRRDVMGRVIGAVSTWHDVTREQDSARSLPATRALGSLLTGTDSRILECSLSAAEMLGVSPEEAVGKVVRDLCDIAEGGVPIKESPVLVATRTARPHDAGVLSITRRDGTVRWVRVEAVPHLVAGVVERVLVTLIDVSALHAGEAALRNERRRLAHAGDRFRRLLESIPDAIAVYHENRFGYGNAALVEMFGYQSAAELVGREVTSVLPGHFPVARDATTLPAGLREESWQLANGKVAIVEIATHAFAIDDEEATLLIARDVTGRKHAQDELIRSGRLASVGTLAAGVAHEINNPLSYVIINLELMGEAITRLDDVLGVATANDLLAMNADARAGAEQVRKIVRGMKTFSRADEERRVRLNVHPLLDTSVEMAFNEIRHRARLVKEYGEVPFVEADEGRLGQVFINLLVNAAQSIPEGRADKNEVRVTTSTDDKGRAVIVVGDTGAGIPSDVIGRIFDPFFTTKPIGVGTGLGLSICHGIVKALGGELSVATTLGEGTRFRVVLPPAAVGAAHEIEPIGSAPTPGPRGRVLIVDDDPLVAEAMRRLLAREHDAVAVNDARDALARIAGGESFDVIVCDLMMPVMTGMDFHSELERVAPALAAGVVFVTGGAFTPDASSFLDALSNPVVEKPYDGRKLLALVGSLVRTRPCSSAGGFRGHAGAVDSPRWLEP